MTSTPGSSRSQSRSPSTTTPPNIAAAQDPEEVAYLKMLQSLAEEHRDVEDDPFGLNGPLPDLKQHPPLSDEELRAEQVLRRVTQSSHGTEEEEEEDSFRAQQSRLKALASVAAPIQKVKEDARRARAPAPPGLNDPLAQKRVEERLLRLETADKAMAPTLSARNMADRRTSIRQADLVLTTSSSPNTTPSSSPSPADKRTSVRMPPSSPPDGPPLAPPVFFPIPKPPPPSRPMPSPPPPPPVVITPSLLIAAAVAAVSAHQQKEDNYSSDFHEDVSATSQPSGRKLQQHISAPVDDFNAQAELSRLKTVENERRPENKVVATNGLDGEHLASVLARSVPVLSVSDELPSQGHKEEEWVAETRPTNPSKFRPSGKYEAMFPASVVYVTTWQHPFLSVGWLVLLVLFWLASRRWSFVTAAALWLAGRLLLFRVLGRLGSLAVVGDGFSALRIFQFEDLSFQQAIGLALLIAVLGRAVMLGSVAMGFVLGMLVAAPLYLRFPWVTDYAPFFGRFFPSLLPTTRAQIAKRYRWRDV